MHYKFSHILEYQVLSGVHDEDLWIESLDSDGQQFHQYQQNKVTSHLKSLNTKRPWHDIGNPDPDFGQAQKCGRGKPVIGIPTLLSCKIFFSINIGPLWGIVT